MKSSNLWRVIWIISIYALLGIVLFLVISYKVKWEDKDLNTYLYLYECSNNVCSSTVKQDSYYSKLLCEDEVCPYVKEINNNNLILVRNDKRWLYNYFKSELISDKYLDYRYIGKDMYVVIDNADSYGIINDSGEVIVDLKYDYIDNYVNGIISYKQDNLYGIKSVDGMIDIKPRYDDIVLINDKIFAGMKDNVYHLYSYNDYDNNSSNTYDFVYAYDNVIFVVNNKKIDILDADLNSTLLLKIDAFYDYKVEKERETLNFSYEDGGYINFKVFINENEYNKYKYNINTKKLV